MTRPASQNFLTRQEIEGLIADGGNIIILDGDVLKLDGWAPYHPGGHKAIQHVVGRDATDEITALHSSETRSQMRRFRIGRIQGRWENLIPPIQGGVYQSILDVSPPSKRSPNHAGNGSNLGKGVRVSNRASTAHDRTTQCLQKHSGFLAIETQREIDFDLSKYPSLDNSTQDKIVEKYRLLGDRIDAEGLYDCNYSAYAWEAARCSALFAIMLLLLHAGWTVASATFLGLFWSQLVFVAHDAGHMGITHNFSIDTTIGMIIAAPIGGLSLGWWKRTHNVHHIVTNSPEHDPDNQHLPIFAVNHRFFGNIFSTYHERPLVFSKIAEALVPYQAYLYYPVLAFGRFNLYVQSWIFLAKGQGPRKGQAWWHRWFEIAGNMIFWLWFGYGIVLSIPTAWERCAFVLVSHMVTLPLHVQFTLSHFAMSTTDLGPHESFAQRMLRTTMDVDCPEWLDFFHGGLQFQAIHHLYPRVPRHNLRRTQKLVQEFCSEVNIPYALYTFVDGNKEIVGSLAEVGRQASVLAECQRTIAQKNQFTKSH